MYSEVTPQAAASGDRSSPAVAISIEGVGKCYEIYDKPRDRLLQTLMRGRRKYFREFWAVRDVSFTVHKGETVGIIGRNGSGKSTLLQMICGTLNPTLGQITVNGKVAALLELGAGFNPEFTGRENVYMAAALYGLSNAEIDARYPKIIAFADIGDHLDQPVKTYSSGMYVRLAFAVIANVDADILVVDEALAVGDAVFTQKCMRFIREFKKKGTLLFVSHDMGSVLNLCKRSVWLNQGAVVEIGEAKTIAESYLRYTLQQVYGEEANLAPIEAAPVLAAEHQGQTADTAEHDLSLSPVYESINYIQENLTSANGWRSGGAEITAIELLDSENQGAAVLKGGERVTMRITAKALQDLDSPVLGFLVRDRLGQDLFGENTLPFTDVRPVPIAAGQSIRGEFSFTLPRLPNGQYTVMASVANGDLHTNTQHHWLHDALVINVSSSKVRWGLVGVDFKHVSLNPLL